MIANTVLKFDCSITIFKSQGTCPGSVTDSSNDVRIFFGFVFLWLLSSYQLCCLMKNFHAIHLLLMIHCCIRRFIWCRGSPVCKYPESNHYSKYVYSDMSLSRERVIQDKFLVSQFLPTIISQQY